MDAKFTVCLPSSALRRGHPSLISSPNYALQQPNTMGNTSSSSKRTKPLVTKQDEAILQMKIQRDDIKKYQRRIRTVLDREREIARECLAKGDKRRALLALRKKKYQEQLLVQTDKHLQTLEELVCIFFLLVAAHSTDNHLDPKR